MRVVNPNKGYDGWNADGTPYSEPAHRQITIFDLLTHTSGMSYGYGFGKQGGREGGRVSVAAMEEVSPSFLLFSLPPSLPPSLPRAQAMPRW